MFRRYRFDIYKLKVKHGIIRDWMRNHSIPKNVTFILLGIISTVWFLIRVIPKPSRATYPCMRIAAPFMSGFILYLISVWALTVAAGKQKLKIINVRFASTFMLVFGVVAVMAISPAENIQSLNKEEDTRTGPADGPNEPMGSGIGVNPGPSLGIHEHWNNPEQKQYSRNLGKSYGIELVSIPDTLVKYSLSANSSKSDNPDTLSGTTTKRQSKTKTEPEENNLVSGNARTNTETRKGEKLNVISLNFSPGFPAKKFYSALVDGNDIKWFLTDAGIVSFDGKIWALHNKNRKVPANDLRSFAYDFTSYGHELWVASPSGATVVTMPVDARSGATTYDTENTTIVSDNVLSIAIGKSPLRWFGTDKGISAFYNKKWLSNSYQRKYPESLFKDFPITSMAASPDGDSLYVGTLGAGVARVYRNKVDGVSGASEYAQWGPIELPSDNIYSILVASDGTQWFGTDMGVARHEGYKTLENWKIFTIENGLVNNFVQALAIDKAGHIWFGTKGGASVFDGIKWISYTTKEGLINDNILSIAVDKEGIVWLGTEDGVVSIKDWNITNFTQ